MTGGSTQIRKTDSSANSPVADSPTWDPETENTPVYAVVSAVANEAGLDLVELPPLNEVIDPDALNALFTSRSETTVSRICFQYAGYEVAVEGSGAVDVQSVHEA